MTRYGRRGVLIALLVLIVFATGHLSADEETAKQPVKLSASPSETAVLDVARAIRGWEHFNQQLKKLKTEVARYETKFRFQKIELEKLAAQRKMLKEGSEEYVDLTVLLTREAARFKKEAAQAKQEMLLREALLYKKNYMLIQQVVAQYAKARGIRLVIRYSSPTDSEESQDPKQILKELNNQVVFQDQVDITEDIIKALNQRTAQNGDAPEIR